MLILELSVNDCAKHVVLLLVMGHAVNTLYIYIYIYINHMPGWSNGSIGCIQ
jgi:fucose 4-O-acetylase-like acetyltransferase